MTSVDLLLDELAPSDGWTPLWADVLNRAGQPSAVRKRGSRRRVAALVFAVLIVALIPLVAVAASNGWWFLKYGSPESRPSRTPVEVTHGTFSGHDWQLLAYPSANGLCWSLTFTDHAARGGGSALACAPVVGSASTHPNPELAITWLASGGDKIYPAWIAGPVIPTAETVRIRIGTRTITTPTVEAPAELGDIRFYAVQVPKLKPSHLVPGTGKALTWVAGYDSHGQVVACLRPGQGGISPFSACR